MQGYEPVEVVRAVKRALWRVREDTRVPISRVDLTLKTVQVEEAGFRLKIPFLADLGAGASARQTVTQTIDLSFVLPEFSSQELAGASLEAGVERMVAAFRDMVEVASDGAEGKPLLFRNGSAQVEFVFDAAGQIELVFSVAVQGNYANTVRVVFGEP